MRRRVARFNRVATNRVQGLWAGLLPPWAMVVHQGRRSGRRYRTPVVAYRHGREFVVGLPYGEDSDWVQNLLAAGSATVRRAGRTLVLRDPHVVPRRAADGIPRRARWFIVPSRLVLVATVTAT
ncbi:MAG TPA: nitroreductase family deazaflavin-dependent oxidoreductase [Acidimicrobiales bacterium]|jgi:deazaflavin-dependent oxidoreductase (nitroreductase family)|nr:nitroreductase family deazaflavin-dependent oxidoreductase [Acidimicrobiales bacterium]